MPAPSEFVFGYGSLVALGHLAPTRAFAPEGFVTDLRDFRRCWGVAMNNRVTLPGYKYYLDERGHRPDVYVAFLDVRSTRGHSVNGVCLPVTREQLDALDDRERNYLRRDVTAFCEIPDKAARVWTYVGTPAGRRRLTTGRSAGRAVIDNTYLASVVEAFESLGPAEYGMCAPSLGPDGLPVLPLERHDLVLDGVHTR
ncbi:MAG: gamma-glutamylcyclotransferase [Actinomycetota bacterium]|nr:gamma-glutamylcyclotransferase [Actinomycetota bacterium]